MYLPPGRRGHEEDLMKPCSQERRGPGVAKLVRGAETQHRSYEDPECHILGCHFMAV